MTPNASILEFLTILRQPVNFRLTGLLRLQEALPEDPKMAALSREVAAAIALDEPLLEHEMRWRGRRRKGAEHGEEARELDSKLDNLLGAIDATLAAQSRLASARPERAAALEALREELFPGGVGVLIHSDYGAQAHATRGLIQRAREGAERRGLLIEIGLGEAFEELAELNAAYTAAVSAHEPLNFEKLEAERLAGHQRLGAIVARILGLFPSDSPEDREARGALLAPIKRQEERLRALYRERRRGDEAVDELGEAELPEAA